MSRGVRNYGKTPYIVIMTDLMRYAAQLDSASLSGTGANSLPPVHRWDPPFCGDIDMVIAKDGTWFHEGTPIGRARLVRLFSSVLKREGDDYFLVTPVEKLGIKVVDAPFLAVLCQLKKPDDDNKDNANQELRFTTNVGEEIVAGKDNPLIWRGDAKDENAAPYLLVRDGLEAKVARSVFYDLVEWGEMRSINGQDQFGVVSQEMFFPFGLKDEIFDR